MCKFERYSGHRAVRMESRPHFSTSQPLLDWTGSTFGELYPFVPHGSSGSLQSYQYDTGGPCDTGLATHVVAGGQTTQTPGLGCEFEFKGLSLPHENTREYLMSGKKRAEKSPHKAADAGSEAGPSERKYSRLGSVTSSAASVVSEDFGGFDSDDESNRLEAGSTSPTLGEDRKKGNRQNHSEIEKRRRDKMNLYINELSQVVPLCVTMSHKLDKLTVLRMAVQHLKTIRGSIHSYTEGDYKPAFLSDEELKKLILQSADGFLFVVDCDRGRILYMSESVSQVLNYSQADLLGQSWFDILHPKDVAKVKEQLSSSDLCPRERLIDAKTMLPVKTEIQQNSLHRLCPGARRSFFCRMRCKVTSQVKEEADSSTGCSGSSSRQRKTYNINREKKYSVIHCTGYLKSWAPSKLGTVHSNYQEDGSDSDPCNLSCLVAVGRIQPSVLSPQGLRGRIISKTGRSPEDVQLEYISRHAIDGKFTFVEQKATLIHGYLPQEMLGTSIYEYLHAEDMFSLAASHKAALQKKEEVISPVFRFRTREGTFIRLQTRLKSFRNPWTKELECILARNSFMISEGLVESTDVSSETLNLDLYSGSRGGRQQELEASKIGQAIADEVMDSLRRSSSGGGSTLGPSPSSLLSGETSPFSASGSPGVALGDVGINHGDSSNGHSQSSSLQSARNNQRTPLLDLRNNRQIAHMLSEAGLQGDDEMLEVIGGLMNDVSGPGGENDSTNANVSDGIDGNDEAAMAVVMSLLEADAGLGGPVDFSGLPWPLP